MPTTLVWMNVAGPVDRAIDMAFGREMQNGVGLKIGQRGLHRRRVGDIRADKPKARMVPSPPVANRDCPHR